MMRIGFEFYARIVCFVAAAVAVATGHRWFAAAALVALVFTVDHLPFLGPTVVPHAAFSNREIDQARINVEIPVPDDETIKQVIFWASGPGTGPAKNPREAYGDFSNTGTSDVTPGSIANVKIHCPRSYVVQRFGRKKKLDAHVHYRFAHKNGLLSKVNTANVVCD